MTRCRFGSSSTTRMVGVHGRSRREYSVEQYEEARLSARGRRGVIGAFRVRCVRTCTARHTHCTLDTRGTHQRGDRALRGSGGRARQDWTRSEERERRTLGAEVRPAAHQDFEVKPQGACRADLCIPILKDMMRGEYFNLTAFARKPDRPP